MIKKTGHGTTTWCVTTSCELNMVCAGDVEICALRNATSVDVKSATTSAECRHAKDATSVLHLRIVRTTQPA
eukprot:jgi/Antlo1/559/456